MAFHYHLWNHRIISDFDLGELDPLSGHACPDTLTIQRIPQSNCEPPATPAAFECPPEDGQVWYIAWKIEDGYLVQFPDLCTFRILPERMLIQCAPEAGVPETSVAHMILDHAIPRLLALRPGFIVLHACAIQIEDKVVAVIGQSGQGKSTLAAWFASQGAPLLTDDCLVLRRNGESGEWLAQPSYHSVRLWPDSVDALGIPSSKLREFAGYSAKRRTGREVDFHFAGSGAPLDVCFVLPGSAGAGEVKPAHFGPPEVRPLSINDAFLALAGAVFRIEVDNPRINRCEFEALASLTESTRFWSLEYERKYSWLGSVRAAMIKAIQESAQKDRH